MTATENYYRKARSNWRTYPTFRTPIENAILSRGAMREYATKGTINNNRVIHEATKIKFRRKYGFGLNGAPIAVLGLNNYWYRLQHSIMYHKGRIYEIAGYMKLVIEPEPGKYQKHLINRDMI